MGVHLTNKRTIRWEEKAQLLLIGTQTVCFKTQRQKTNVVNLKHHNFDDVSFREFFARIIVFFSSLQNMIGLYAGNSVSWKISELVYLTCRLVWSEE